MGGNYGWGEAIMLSCIFPAFREKWLVCRQAGMDETEAISPSVAIRVNTSRLPRAFREKFRLGDRGIRRDGEGVVVSGSAFQGGEDTLVNGERILFSGIIDESEGDIRITCFNLELRDRMALMEAIRSNGKNKNGDSIKNFLKNFTKKSISAGQKLLENGKCKFVMYLEVGDGVYWHVERFERLIIVRDGEIEKNLVCGGKVMVNGEKKFDQLTTSRKKFEAMVRNIGAKLVHGIMAIGDYFTSDDGNIQNELKTNREFCDAFYGGEAKIIVYHRAVQSLTLLCFEQHDERVAAIDRRRDFFLRSKSAMGFAMCALIFYIIGHAVNTVPPLGNNLGIVCRFVAAVTMGVALHKGYRLFPMPWRMGVGNFMGTKIGPHLPFWGTWRRRMSAAAK
jgi:hypothetical protein